MTKKGNLSAALSQFDQRHDHPAAAPSSASNEARTVTDGKMPLPPSRQGKRALTGYFEPEVLRQLKLMAVTEDTTIQALLTEALNDLFKKHGKPHIA